MCRVCRLVDEKARVDSRIRVPAVPQDLQGTEISVLSRAEPAWQFRRAVTLAIFARNLIKTRTL